MIPSKSYNIISNHKLNLCWVLYLCILSNHISLYAQFNEINFEKVNIEIDGEKVYSVATMTQDHKGYIWMLSNLGIVRYNGIPVP